MRGIGGAVSNGVASDGDIAGRAFRADPHPLCARPRAEAPLCRVPIADPLHTWLVTRYDDVVAVLEGGRFIKRGCSRSPTSGSTRSGTKGTAT